MKKIYFLTLFAAVWMLPSQVSAQLSIDPETSYTDVDPSIDETVAYSFVTNESDETKTFTWNRAEMAITEGWNSAICDANTCYTPAVSTPPQYFILGPSESGNIDVHIYPNEIEGSAIIRVTISEVGNFSNNVTAFYYFNESVSVPEHLNEAITLYPNPAENQVFIQQGKSVERVEVFSLSGRKVLDASVRNQNVLDVAQLSTGTYVARLYNAQGEQVSNNMLIKK